MLNRRCLLRNSAAGFGYLALTGLLAEEAAAAEVERVRRALRDGKAPEGGPVDPLAPRLTHFPARAKRVLFLFMKGGPSHLDTFDPKPLLERDHGRPLPFEKPRVQF